MPSYPANCCSFILAVAWPVLGRSRMRRDATAGRALHHGFLLCGLNLPLTSSGDVLHGTRDPTGLLLPRAASEAGEERSAQPRRLTGIDHPLEISRYWTRAHCPAHLRNHTQVSVTHLSGLHLWMRLLPPRCCAKRSLLGTPREALGKYRSLVFSIGAERFQSSLGFTSNHTGLPSQESQT